ncbi:MAG: AraC family transcriptional regulator, partial [Kangiellaceae bacterium]|nr:AraC family transcriptional regulator [Kangiellaceae bacterium]
MSAFNDFVNLLKLEVEIYHNAKVCGNWEIQEHELGKTCFHIVTSGSCMLSVPGLLEIQFNQGDLVIFPKELAHKMWPVDSLKGPQEHVHYESELAGTGMLCGEVRVMHLYQNQLLEALPPVLLIRNSQENPWLGQLTKLLLEESTKYQESKSVTLNRLSEMVFVYALRHHIESEDSSVGLLALYGDTRITKAIKRFHDNPQQKWALDALASEAGMSRTRFSKRFKGVSGWTVGQYISWWRMQLAWEKLSAGDKVISVAEQVGYQSEAA